MNSKMRSPATRRGVLAAVLVVAAFGVTSCAGGGKPPATDGPVTDGPSTDTPVAPPDAPVVRDAGEDRAPDRPAPADAGPESDAGVGPIDASVEAGEGGAPTKLPIGRSCGGAAECASGFCVDGVCCNSACAGVCYTCAAQGSVGTCLPADVGTDPRDQCAEQGVSTCGTDGYCDGAGACRRYVAGAICRAASCTGSTSTLPFRCSASGACVPSAAQPCDPYMCGTDGRCLTACTQDRDCIAPYSCNGGSCGKRPLGGTCGTDADCLNGVCQQGVCCSGPCTSPCMSCAVAGSAGTCTYVPAGEDPLGQCVPGDVAQCGTDGTCDGHGGCRLYTRGTICEPSTCSGTTVTTPGRCDGTGTCSPGAVQTCAPYACGATGGQCNTSCSSNADCAPGNVCNAGICGKRLDGQTCTSAAECQSGFCAQGVCCSSACAGTCMSCGLPGTEGSCTPIPSGSDPLNQCADSGAESCGTDGVCNGAGACRLYSAGTVCISPSCSGSSSTLAGRCNGTGDCVAGTMQSCSPFMCSPTGGCRTVCATSADCLAPNTCIDGSCGKKPLGAACGSAPECDSGFCEQGVCCSSACSGICRSCALTGTGGTCTTVPAGSDPLGHCGDQGAASCSTNGACDGTGACQLYSAGTQCAGAACTGTSYTSPRTCNGAGVCQLATTSSCGAYVCGAGGTQCLTSCTGNADCVAPNVCIGGICTKKPLGSACIGGSECDSGLCQQNVCCSSSCTGTCKSCAVPGSVGTCANVPAGVDPLNQCADNGAASCGTDGTCDGSGACRLYAVGTQCAAASCTGSSYTPSRSCNGLGVCQTVSSSLCDPYVCGGDNRCLTTCTTNTHCSAPNTCANGSCGKKPIGAACGLDGECNSGFCAQGVCCATACTGTCRSCALTGSAGTCTAVPPGEDPLNQCTDEGGATCGRDGTCDGSGGCRLYANGTVCVGSSCTGTAFTPARTCDGAGVCRTVVAGTCGAYVCGPSGTCLTTCTSNAECVAPNTCNGGVCSRKANGATCGGASECLSGFCEQGVCCASACTGICRSCALGATAGTCTLVSAGQDPLEQCTDQGTSTCGTDGTCDGGGGCRLYVSGTTCAAASCTGSTFTPARTCNGTGTCQSVTTTTCNPYICGANACKASCATSADCVSPFSCVNGVCTTKGNGSACTAGSECTSGLCQQGICCSTACTGTCKSCALAGSLGTCANVGTGLDPLGQCADQGAATCGTDGTCDGNGACKVYGTGTVCVAQSCTGSTYTPARTCNGSGTCQAVTSSACAPYVCGASGACRSSCTTSAECVAPYSCIGGACTLKSLAAACTSGAECQSGFCAQGVCCASACSGTCQSCALAGNAGTCMNVPAGSDPLNQCTDQGAATCGTDGQCNGSGACRLYSSGTTCAASSCSGTSYTPARTCDGGGACRTVTATSCDPYVCGSGQCRTSCTLDSHCLSPNTCQGGVCGKKANGATCASGAECVSGVCAQNVCCNVTCGGVCQACNLTATVGTCTNVPAGQDPLAQCTDQGAATCGTDGQCDGNAACRYYASGTSCLAGSCTGSTYTPARTCNGAGVCQTVTSGSCAPYVCGATGSCLASCTGNADCVAPNVCSGGVCVRKSNGVACSAAAECLSGFCEQGVCCATACAGTCMSCALTSAAGTCMNVPAGADPLNQCTDGGAATCGNDGQCDGSGACRKYASGTTCVAASCSGSAYTPARTCNGAGVCQTVSAGSCSPYVCASATACKTTCTANSDCVSPFSCIGGVCTKRANGSTCSAAAECVSGFCEQGICCGTACAGTCKSCALATSLGTCTNVPAGQDPLAQCADDGVATCGQDGSCNGSGACRTYAAGTVCVAQSCTGSTYTPARTCSGGACQTVTSTSCGAYACSASGTCNSSCTTDAQCVAPNTCNGGVCTKKANGVACTAGGQCLSGFCEQGVCCGTACTATCMSCALSGSVGTCTNVAAGADPLSQCTDQGASTCGTDGACDGSGACRIYGAGTVCVAGTCSGSTVTPARTCNGTGTCQTVTSSTCAPFNCGTNGQCLTSCTSNANCVSPNTCINGSCGKKAVGTACTSASECQSNYCEQGICCSTACTGTCKSCALTGSLGTCGNVPAGQDPLNHCIDEGASTCGDDGTCNGSGGCRLYSSSTVCVAASCTGSTYTAPRLCNGTGTCRTSSTSACDPYVCGTNACKTSCTADTDCQAPNTCQGGVCTKKANGIACGSGPECSSGFCAQGVCCNAACTGTCMSCALTNSVGVCTAAAVGTDPLNQCTDQGAATCGTDGACNGSGACRYYASGTTCAAASCTGSTFTPAQTCNGSGLCQTVTASSCSPYICGTNACRTSCTTTADCLSPFTCIGGVCTKKANGATCASGVECTSGNCAQGVCCNLACGGTCEACNLTGSIGNCSKVPAGSDPLNQCADATAATCGTDGACDGAGACRLYAAGVVCVAASCTTSTYTPARTCNGTGTCQTATSVPCNPYICGTGACRTNCTTNAHCLSPYTCIGGVCTTKPAGATCTAGAECSSGYCAQGVCCDTACSGTCQACNLTGTVGTCRNVPAGDDPLAQCADQGASTCGTDGACNGAGACRLYSAGTSCAGAVCSGSTYTPGRTCNGTGTCQAASSSSCSPYVCNASNACLTACTSNADCLSPNTCNGGVCSKKANGVACSAATECQSGFCAQGRCCNTACTGTCTSCALSTSLGTCTNVPGGEDPLNQCTDQGVATCGTDGACNGSGACRLYASGTTCAGATCSGSTYTPARTCNGSGTCQAVTSTPCNPYICGANACNTTCTTSAGCVSPYICSGGICTLKSNGVACSAAGECQSGHCEQGVCCSTACTGTCKSCALAATAGTCANVSAGEDPLAQCADGGASTCGQDGTCNGSGACRLYVSGTVCAAASCSGSTATSERTCNGTGTCQTGTTSSCTPYVCGTTACKTTCATSADCLAPNICVGTTCVAPGLKVQHYAGSPINVSDNFVRPTLRIANSGTASVPLAELTIRYWLTRDTTETLSAACDTAGMGCNNLTMGFTAVSPARTGADYYLQVGFLSGAGSVAAGGTTGLAQLRVYKLPTYTNFNEADDHSYAGNAAFTDAPKITLYRNGVLVWGTEP